MSNSKSKLLDTEHGEEVVEQLNLASMDCLPDDLLVQILSFLTTKEAVSTSILVELMFSSKKRDWKVLPLLLERSPNLKTLILSGLHRYTFGRRHRFIGIRIPPDNQIKMLSIKQYQGSENELKHISHCLLKMECLEVVKVYVAARMDDLKKMQLTDDLLKLPPASSELKIQIM